MNAHLISAACVLAGASLTDPSTMSTTPIAVPTASDATLRAGTAVPASAALVTAEGSTTPRTLASRFSDVINVKDYGAHSTDDPHFTRFDSAPAIQAAANAGSHVFIPAGTYRISSTIHARDGLVIEGAGTNATILQYAGRGVAINMAAITRGAVRHVGLVLGNPGATGIAMAGQDNAVEDFFITGTAAIGLRVTGDGVAHQSLTTYVSHGEIKDVTGTALQVDHATDVYVTDVHLFAPQGSTTAQPLVIDTGTSGIYFKSVVTGWGRNCLLVRNSSPGPGPYGQSPIYLFFDQFVGDASTGGDAWKFDASLGTDTLSAHFTNSWAASAGWGADGIATHSAHAVHISGGSGIYIGAGTRLYRASGSGVLIDSPHVSNVTIEGASIHANNQDGAPDQHGVHLAAAATHVSVLNSYIGNTNIAGGHQRYGIKIAPVEASSLRIIGNDLSLNEYGPLANGATGSYTVAANLPASAGQTLLGPIRILSESGGTTLAIGQGARPTAKQLVISTTPDADVIDFQGIQQGLAHNQTLRFQHAGGSTSFGSTGSEHVFAGAVHLPTDAGAPQQGRVSQGRGEPRRDSGSAGDLYFRTDTPTVPNQRVYVQTAGGWVGIL